MGDLVRVGTFFPNLWSLNFFPQHIAEQDFFSALYAMSDMFFLVQYIFLPRYFLALFFRSNSVGGIFFSEITHNPLKRQMVGPEVHQIFALYSFFLRIVKDWNSLQTISSMMKLTLTKKG